LERVFWGSILIQNFMLIKAKNDINANINIIIHNENTSSESNSDT